jgi:hypothetical protein
MVEISCNWVSGTLNPKLLTPAAWKESSGLGVRPTSRTGTENPFIALFHVFGPTLRPYFGICSTFSGTCTFPSTFRKRKWSKFWDRMRASSYFVVIHFVTVLWIKFGVLHMLGKWSITEPSPQPWRSYLFIFVLYIIFLDFFCWDWMTFLPYSLSCLNASRIQIQILIRDAYVDILQSESRWLLILNLYLK